MKLNGLYYETTDMTEVEWLAQQNIKPDMLHEEKDRAVVFSFHKAPELFLSLARLYHQTKLQNEFDAIESSFSLGEPLQPDESQSFLLEHGQVISWPK